MTRVLLDYRNVPSAHCGSGAMSNLLRHYAGVEIPEPVVFGLGSGIDLLYLDSGGADPAVMVFGRGVTLEVDVALALDVDYRETPEPDDDAAWEIARREIIEGRPTMLSGDIFYLDYREFRAHFPGHRFVMVGFDDETQKAWIADRTDAEPQPCSYGALRKSRNSREGISSYNLWGKFHDTRIRRELPGAVGVALEKTARRMTGADTLQTDLIRMLSGKRRIAAWSGLSGLARYAEGIGEWAGRENGRTIAWYAGQCIEKFGTGGGNFRKMYAEFLVEARRLRPDLVDADAPAQCAASATAWTRLADVLAGVREADDLPGLLAGGASILREILEIETRLFESMAARAGL